MSKTPVILLHGALGAQTQFEPWLPELEKEFEVYRFDFEGHGSRAFPDRPFRIEYFAENLEDFIHENDLAPARIFGYSMGGYVALWLASQKPELIDKIFTFATKLDWNPETSAKEAKMLNADKILEKVPMFAEALEKRHFGNDWRGHLERTAEMMKHLGEKPLLTEEVFKGITIPVRIGIGDRDTMVSLEETIAAFRSIPGAELFVRPATQHPVEKFRLRNEELGFLNG